MSTTSCEGIMSERLVKRVFWILGGLLFTVGLIGWYDRLVHGHLNMNYGTVVPWGLGVALYIYFMGLSTGSYFISSIAYVFKIPSFIRIGRLAVFTALVALLLSLLCVWADVGHMSRVWHLFVYANLGSPMAWATWFYSAYGVLLMTELWVLLRRDFVAEAGVPGVKGSLCRLLSLGAQDQSEVANLRDRRRVRTLAIAGLPLALGAAVGAGVILGVVAARPQWHSGLFPILFLVSALASGSAFLIPVVALFQDGWGQNRDIVLVLGRIALGFLCVEVFFLLSEIVVAFYGGIPGHLYGFTLVFGGPYWWVFWVWQLALGTLIPGLLLVAPTREDPHWVTVAGLLIAAGFLALRLNLVIPGLAVEEIRGLSEAIASPRLSTHYFPSVMEWLVSAGIVGLGMLLFSLGDRMLPKESRGESHVRL